MSYFESQTITFEAALRDLAHGSDRARARAAMALGDVTEPDQRQRATRALIPVLSDLRPEIRAAACTSLGELGGPDAVDGLVSCLEDGVPHVRQAAAISLGRLDSDDAFARLQALLTDGPPDMRFQAATSLVEIDPERAVGPLQAAIADESDAEVQAAIALALASAGADAREPIARLLDSERAHTRFDAACALARLGDDAGLAVLRDAVDDKELCWTALAALEQLATEGAAQIIAAVLSRRLAARELRLRAAAALLAAAPEHGDADRAQSELLAGLAARWRGDVRTLATGLIAEVGGAWAVSPLREALRAGRGGADDISAALERIDRRLHPSGPDTP